MNSLYTPITASSVYHYDVYSSPEYMICYCAGFSVNQKSDEFKIFSQMSNSTKRLVLNGDGYKYLSILRAIIETCLHDTDHQSNSLSQSYMILCNVLISFPTNFDESFTFGFQYLIISQIKEIIADALYKKCSVNLLTNMSNMFTVLIPLTKARIMHERILLDVFEILIGVIDFLSGSASIYTNSENKTLEAIKSSAMSRSFNASKILGLVNYRLDDAYQNVIREFIYTSRYFCSVLMYLTISATFNSSNAPISQGAVSLQQENDGVTLEVLTIIRTQILKIIPKLSDDKSVELPLGNVVKDALQSRPFSQHGISSNLLQQDQELIAKNIGVNILEQFHIVWNPDVYTSIPISSDNVVVNQLSSGGNSVQGGSYRRPTSDVLALCQTERRRLSYSFYINVISCCMSLLLLEKEALITEALRIMSIFAIYRKQYMEKLFSNESLMTLLQILQAIYPMSSNAGSGGQGTQGNQQHTLSTSNLLAKAQPSINSSSSYIGNTFGNSNSGPLTRHRSETFSFSSGSFNSSNFGVSSARRTSTAEFFNTTGIYTSRRSTADYLNSAAASLSGSSTSGLELISFFNDGLLQLIPPLQSFQLYRLFLLCQSGGDNQGEEDRFQSFCSWLAIHSSTFSISYLHPFEIFTRNVMPLNVNIVVCIRSIQAARVRDSSRSSSSNQDRRSQDISETTRSNSRDTIVTSREISRSAVGSRVILSNTLKNMKTVFGLNNPEKLINRILLSLKQFRIRGISFLSSGCIQWKAAYESLQSGPVWGYQPLTGKKANDDSKQILGAYTFLNHEDLGFPEKTTGLELHYHGYRGSKLDPCEGPERTRRKLDQDYSTYRCDVWNNLIAEANRKLLQKFNPSAFTNEIDTNSTYSSAVDRAINLQSSEVSTTQTISKSKMSESNNSIVSLSSNNSKILRNSDLDQSSNMMEFVKQITKRGIIQRVDDSESINSTSYDCDYSGVSTENSQDVITDIKRSAVDTISEDFIKQKLEFNMNSEEFDAIDAFDDDESDSDEESEDISISNTSETQDNHTVSGQKCDVIAHDELSSLGASKGKINPLNTIQPISKNRIDVSNTMSSPVSSAKYTSGAVANNNNAKSPGASEESNPRPTSQKSTDCQRIQNDESDGVNMTLLSMRLKKSAIIEDVVKGLIGMNSWNQGTFYNIERSISYIACL